jgi:ribosome biogenesis GTPase
MQMDNLGYNETLATALAELGLEDVVPGRIVWQSAYDYRVWCESGEVAAQLTGKIKSSGRPGVGDWVALRPEPDQETGTIVAILPRKSVFSRSAAGKSVSEQVVAANIDEVFIVTDLDTDFNVRRIERYITMVYNSGAIPVVVLNKTDLAQDVQAVVDETESVSPGVPVYAVSAEDGEGLEQLEGRLGHGVTVAFLGSSGVGKSALINCLLGEERMEVGEVREADGKGRHTTTHRELIPLPEGGAVIDTPGMREISVWGDEQGLTEAFPEIDDLARYCRFRDCRHEIEEGCAVIEGAESGDIDPDRLDSYRKLRAEFENLEVRKSQAARIEEKRAGKRFAKMVREVNEHNPKRKR